VPLIPLDEALSTVLAGCAPLVPRPIPLAVAHGCVLADDVVATQPMPPFANTAMDGYAVRAEDVVDVPVQLDVVGQVGAGHVATRGLEPGQAMRIFTGAPIPDGADSIVIVENTERVDSGARVEIQEPAKLGAHIRPVGDDVEAGDVVARAGEVVTPGRFGVLRSVGIGTVRCVLRPRVGVLSTGDELVTGAQKLQPGQIYDSNRPTLLALVAEAGGEPVDLGHAPDEEAMITAAFNRGVEGCDLVLSTGGVSMGDTDLVKVVLDKIGEMRWMQVAIKPAKPLAFGVVDVHGVRRVPMIGLPGNPVSSMVSFELFARPALRRLAGYPDDRLSRPRLAALAEEPFTRHRDGKTHFVRVIARVVDGGLRVRSAGGQGSHQLSGMAAANALAVLPDGDGIPAGTPVAVLVTGDLTAT
jgi:molybdopterin molybdotransferase